MLGLGFCYQHLLGYLKVLEFGLDVVSEKTFLEELDFSGAEHLTDFVIVYDGLDDT
jgi:hypothetical protein